MTAVANRLKAVLMLAAFAASMLSAHGALAQAAEPDSATLASLRTAIAKAQGWTEEKAQFRFFRAKELYDLIDGGAVEYDKGGLAGGIVVHLSGPGAGRQKFT